MRKNASRPFFTTTWAAPLPVWLLAFFLVPMALLFWLSLWDVRNFVLTPGFSLKNWSNILSADFFWAAYLRTAAFAAVMAVLATVIALPVSIAVALVLPERARLLALALLIAPFFTSFPLRIYSWQIYLSENGILMKLSQAMGFEGGSWLNTYAALGVGYLTLTLPVVIVLQSVSLLSIDRVLMDAAQNLRCGPTRTIFQVIIPAAKAGIVIAGLFAFIFVFGDFVAPTYLGGGSYTTLSILIADTVKSGQQWPRAAVISVIMIVTLLAVALAAVKFAYRRRGDAH